MDWLTLAVLVAGLLLGAGLTWLMLRQSSALAYSRGQAESGVERATLLERLGAKTEQLNSLIADREAAVAQAKESNVTLGLEQQSRARAEEQALRIEPLERELAAKDMELRSALQQLESIRSRATELEGNLLRERELVETRIAQLFKALSDEALKSNNQAFLDLAKTVFDGRQNEAKVDLEARQKAIDELVKPLKQTLEEMEKARVGAYVGVTEQIKSLLTTQNQLQSQTSNLVNALGTPSVRGRWGEIQLKRVVEMAGMLNYCDFFEQVLSSDGRTRPDLVVRAPGNKHIIVDSKVPLEAYLEALDSLDEESRVDRLKAHAKQVRAHIVKLGQKNYWDQGLPTPDFVVLFIPGENFYSAALQQDPSLIEAGVKQNIFIATPTTLISLLRTVIYGWRQEDIEANAKRIGEVGRTLHERLSVFVGHFAKIGAGLDDSRKHFNDAVGSFERRLMPSARELRELAATSSPEIPQLATVEAKLRLPILEAEVG